LLSGRRKEEEEATRGRPAAARASTSPSTGRKEEEDVLAEETGGGDEVMGQSCELADRPAMCASLFCFTGVQSATCWSWLQYIYAVNIFQVTTSSSLSRFSQHRGCGGRS
jgi:hypothetical protein